MPDIKHSETEERFIAAGRDSRDRAMFVAFTTRHRNGRIFFRPVSARYMHRKEIESYEEKRMVPKLNTDEEAEAFLAQDLSDLDFSQFKPLQFELLPKGKSINLRILEQLLKSVKPQAKRQGIPYQRYIRQALERAIASKR